MPSTHSKAWLWWHACVILVLGKQRQQGLRDSLANQSSPLMKSRFRERLCLQKEKVMSREEDAEYQLLASHAATYLYTRSILPYSTHVHIHAYNCIHAPSICTRDGEDWV